MQQSISAEFPYESKYVDVLGSKMHYIDEGEGDPILFLHGVPTSSYLWRNVVPHVASSARCIAVDLIGFGQSAKPDIEYSVFDHINHIEKFIETLNLKNLTLVMHAWGSLIGFNYALNHESNIKGLAFYEAHLRTPVTQEMVALPVHEIAEVLSAEDGGYDVIMNSNYYINKVLPSGVLRQLTDTEMQHYQAPFLAAGSCKPIWQFLQELPLGDGPDEIVKLIDDYSQKLTQTKLPKLMFYAVPGFRTTINTVQWAKEHFPNLTLIDIGDALHYAQESNPEILGTEINNWYQTL